MVVVSYSGKEINGKLVYYGPGLSGKTTNLEYIYQSVPSTNRGKMVSMKTRTERTLFFDFLPVELGELGGFKTRFLLYTVPGQVYYNATRKLVLRGVDAVIFVADSARGKMDENKESLQNLKDNLREYGLSLDEVPWVIQYNKRDLPETYSIQELEEALNPDGVPYFEAVATTGEGVFETFRGIAKLLLKKLSKEINLGEAKPAPAAAPGKPAPAAGPAKAVPAASSGEVAQSPAPTGTRAPGDSPRAQEPPRAPAETPRRNVPAEPVVPAPAPAASQEPHEKPEPTEPAVQPQEPQAQEPAGTASVASGDRTETEAEALPAPERKLEPILPEPTAEDDERDRDDGKESRGFWGRLFHRRHGDEEDRARRSRERFQHALEQADKEEHPAAEEAEPKPAPVETKVAEVSIPPVGGSKDTTPVFIEKRIQVPVTLGPEEMVRGARLRLVLEIEVEAVQPEKSRAA